MAVDLFSPIDPPRRPRRPTKDPPHTRRPHGLKTTTPRSRGSRQDTQRTSRDGENEEEDVIHNFDNLQASPREAPRSRGPRDVDAVRGLPLCPTAAKRCKNDDASQANPPCRGKSKELLALGASGSPTLLSQSGRKPPLPSACHGQRHCPSPAGPQIDLFPSPLNSFVEPPNHRTACLGSHRKARGQGQKQKTWYKHTSHRHVALSGPTSQNPQRTTCPIVTTPLPSPNPRSSRRRPVRRLRTRGRRHHAASCRPCTSP